VPASRLVFGRRADARHRYEWMTNTDQSAAAKGYVSKRVEQGGN